MRLKKFPPPEQCRYEHRNNQTTPQIRFSQKNFMLSQIKTQISDLVVCMWVRVLLMWFCLSILLSIRSLFYEYHGRCLMRSRGCLVFGSSQIHRFILSLSVVRIAQLCCVYCAHYCRYLWRVHSCLVFRLSLTFIYYLHNLSPGSHITDIMNIDFKEINQIVPLFFHYLFTLISRQKLFQYLCLVVIGRM